MSETPRIFVSHSHEDDAFCQRLIADLRALLGDDAVWYDASGGLHGSEDWWDRIIAEITERPYFIAVLSPHATASKWVLEEMRIAFRQHVELGKVLLPVRIAPAPRHPNWADTQEFDFQQAGDTHRYATAFAELLGALGIKTDTPCIIPISHDVPIEGAALLPRRLTVTERLAKETHTAYGREHWSDVLDKTDILLEHGAMTVLLWRERASAAFVLNDVRTGLAALHEVLKANPDDLDFDLNTMRDWAQRFVKAGDDLQAVVTLNRAYALASIDDIVTRLLILDDLTKILVRLGRFDELARRVNDACRLAPADSRLRLRQIKALLDASRFDEAIAAAKTIPVGADISGILPSLKAAVAAAAQTRKWQVRRALLDVAIAVGVDIDIVAHWRLDFPHYAELATLSDHKGSVYGVTWASDGLRLATASSDRTAKIWAVNSWQVLATLVGHSDTVTSVAWSTDSLRLATASNDRTVRVWEASSGRPVSTVSGLKKMVSGLKWSPDGMSLATANEDSSATIWEISSGQVLSTLTGHGSAVFGVAWSPDGSRLATSSNDRTAKVWEVNSGRLLATLVGHSGAVVCITWASDGLRLATASSDGTAKLWEANTGLLLATFSGHRGFVSGVSWAPNDLRVATASNDTTVKVWEVRSGRLLATLTGHNDYVRDVAWAPDGLRLATASYDKTVKIWMGE